MSTDCTPEQLELQGFAKGRRLVAKFDGGAISSDGGAVLLRQTDENCDLLERFAGCFTDHREAARCEHAVVELLRQRVYGLALGYEDLNDHDELRVDPLLASLTGKADPTGADRRLERDRGKPLAGKDTLNRLEWGLAEEAEGDRYRRIAIDPEAVDRFFVDTFLDAYAEPPAEITLDLDATDDLLHGSQEGRFYHAYFGGYCYMPLYIFCDSHLLCARLRTADQDASAGSVEELERIVAQIRERWPEVSIRVRADSGFARDALMSWCEAHDVEYVFGLARNNRLHELLDPAMDDAWELCADSGEPERVFTDLRYRTLKSWSRERRVVGKAEITERGPNPRFIVTSVPEDSIDAATLYEKVYCARGDMENRIKEQQLCLFADRTSARLMRVNQIRLWMSSVAYVLMDALRRTALAGTELARAQCSTIRLKLLKIGARIAISVRRIVCSLASSFPRKEVFLLASRRLAQAQPLAA